MSSFQHVLHLPCFSSLSKTSPPSHVPTCSRLSFLSRYFSFNLAFYSCFPMFLVLPCSKLPVVVSIFTPCPISILLSWSSVPFLFSLSSIALFLIRNLFLTQPSSSLELVPPFTLFYILSDISLVIFPHCSSILACSSFHIPPCVHSTMFMIPLCFPIQLVYFFTVLLIPPCSSFYTWFLITV